MNRLAFALSILFLISVVGACSQTKTDTQVKSDSLAKNNASAIPSPTPTPEPPIKVIITNKKKTFKFGKKGSDFYREAEVNYPIASGVSDTITLNKIQKALTPKAIYGDIDGGITSIEYDVLYNDRDIICVSYIVEAMGAYPTTMREYVSVNSRTGNFIKAKDIFREDLFKKLTMLVGKAMQKDITEAIKNAGMYDVEENKVMKEGEEKSNSQEWIKEAMKGKYFRVEDLDNFFIDKNGVTFLYDFGLPHAFKALSPGGSYTFSFDKLKEFIKPDGVLGVFIK